MAVIDREIARVAAQSMAANKNDMSDVQNQAYQEEQTRLLALDKQIAEGRIAAHRGDAARTAVGQATDRIVADADAIAHRIIDNPARRLDTALSNGT